MTARIDTATGIAAVHRLEPIHTRAGDAVPGGQTGHIPELQSIRGIAAFVVALGHPLSFYAPPAWYLPVWGLVNTQAAVTIFFILSGFVLTNSLARRPIDARVLRDFYVKRVFRIYPALWFMSVLALLYVSLLHYQYPIPDAAEWLKGRFQADRYTPVHIVASFAGMLAYLSPPVWTIFLELVASVAMPGVAYLLFRRRPWFVALLAASLLLSLATPRHLYYHIDVYFVDFVLGAALTRLPTTPLLALGRRVPLGLLVLVATGLMMFTRAFVTVELYDPWLAQYEAAFGAFIIFVYGRCGARSRFLSLPETVWLGDISFSLYLMHFTIMCIIAKIFLLAAPGMTLALGGGVSSFLLMLLTIAIALPVAAWTFRHIEQPGIGLGRLVLARLDARRTAPHPR